MTMTLAEVQAELTQPGQLFEMDEVDVLGVPTRVWKHAPPDLRAVLELSRLHGEKDFIVYEDERFTFEQHYRAAAAFATALVDRFDVAKGDRVAIVMRNFPEWVAAFWGAAAIGAVVVPLNAWWTGPELQYGLADSGAKVAVVDAERAERVREHRKALPALAHVVVVRDEGLTVDELGWGDVVRADEDPALPPVDIEPDDDATIFYTSGTTGNPKGALGTHRNICTNVMSLAYGGMASAMRKSGGDPAAGEAMLAAGAEQCSMLSVPLFHVTGCHAFMLGSFAFGFKLVIMHKWDPERALELIERERVTTFGGVPTMVWQVLDSPSFATRDLSSVQTIGYGGAPAAPELVRRIEAMFPGRTPSNGWGMTETSSTASTNAGVDYSLKPDSVGPPIPVLDAKIIDESGADVGVGDLGELAVRGPNVVKGYWNKPEDTATTFVDGWLRTGDIARIDEEGFIYIVDRAKDMVIRGGENVYCAEVEAVLFEHPAVLDCAVIGVPHEVLGEEVGAVIQLKPGSELAVEDIQAHVRERLAGFKVPTHVFFRRDDLPRNPAGKVLKRDLRDEVLGEQIS